MCDGGLRTGFVHVVLRLAGAMLLHWNANGSCNMNVTYRTAEDIRIAGHYFAAGALAASLGKERYYGCHVGMRSTREASMEAFFRGYDAAKADARR